MCMVKGLCTRLPGVAIFPCCSCSWNMPAQSPCWYSLAPLCLTLWDPPPPPPPPGGLALPCPAAAATAINNQKITFKQAFMFLKQLSPLPLLHLTSTHSALRASPGGLVKPWRRTLEALTIACRYGQPRGSADMLLMLKNNVNADGFANARLRRRPRFRTARQAAGHPKVLGLGSHCLPPLKNPRFDFRVTSGTTFFQHHSKSFLVASQNRTPDLAL